ncbi:MAG: hypothetical protein JO019_03485 [Candidatus Kaiserbacteria bacterium]|nr:hypothetical protein [Candidatus Kaiserbacteria bacterium]
MANQNNRSNRSNSSNSSSKRGFAAMDKEKQRKIASMGGKASHGGRSSRGSSR